MARNAIPHPEIQGASIIPLTQGYSAIVDTEDLPLLVGVSWYARVDPKSGVMPAGNIKGKDGKWCGILLHRRIMGITDPKIMVDHRDGNRLLAQKYNLRIATRQVNMRNKVGAHRNNGSSPYLGVTKTRSGTFVARIMIDKKSIYLGQHKTAEAANVARLGAEKKLWGIEPRRAAAHAEIGQ